MGTGSVIEKDTRISIRIGSNNITHKVDLKEIRAWAIRDLKWDNFTLYNGSVFWKGGFEDCIITETLSNKRIDEIKFIKKVENLRKKLDQSLITFTIEKGIRTFKVIKR